MYVSKAGSKVRSQKDRIIKMYEKEGIRILNIAKKYHVGETTIYKYFKKWGVEIIRCSKYEKREFKDKQKFKKRKHWYRKFSKGFLAHRAEITKRYNGKIKYIKDMDLSHDKRMIRNVLSKAFI